MTPALQHLVTVTAAGAPTHELIAALEVWLAGSENDEWLPPEAAPAVRALTSEAEARALLALVEAPAADAYRAEGWLDLVFSVVWLRALAARAVERGGATSFEPSLDRTLEAYFAHSEDLEPARALVRATWPAWPESPSWWSYTAPSGGGAAFDADADAAAEDAELGELVRWGRARMTGDGRFRLSTAEWDRLAASVGGEELLRDAGRLFVRAGEPTHRPAQAPVVTRPNSFSNGRLRQRVQVQPRLAAATFAVGGTWRDGLAVLFQFAATRAWIHPGVGLLAAGQATEIDTDGQPQAAWLVIPEPSITRLEWGGGTVDVVGRGGLVIPVLDPSVRVDVAAIGDGGRRTALLSAPEDFGEGDVAIEDSGVDAELTDILVDIRAADLVRARHRLRALSGSLNPAQRPAVSAIELMLVEGEAP